MGRLLIDEAFPFEVMNVLKQVDVLKPTELYTLKWWILWYVNSTSI